MRVAFATPRYGPEVMGGAETAARQLAEHLVAECGWDVEVFSTCALDHVTWDDVLEPGTSRLNGVTVHRFESAAGRDHDFYGLDGRLRVAPTEATRREAQRWVDLNGPVTPDLIDALADSGVDVAAFYPYLYYPTVRGIGRVPMPGVLHPAAHDEPALYLPVFRGTYTNADALCYHTMAERRLVQRVYPVADRPQIVLGLGVGESAGGPAGGRGPGSRRPALSGQRGPGGRAQGLVDAGPRSSATYKQRHPGPSPWPWSARSRPPSTTTPTSCSPASSTRPTSGTSSRDATISVSPSALESFSLVVLEAWVERVPVVVNATCDPTREHCERSGGGLWFGSYREFEAILDRLLADAALRRTLGERGRAYVDQHYQWPVLIRRYARFLTEVVSRGKGAGGVL